MSNDETVTIRAERLISLIEGESEAIVRAVAAESDLRAAKAELVQFADLKLSAVVAKLKERAAELDSRGGGHQVDNEALAEYGGIMFALRTIAEFTGAK